MTYDHVQRAPLYLLLLAIAAIELVAAILVEQTLVRVALGGSVLLLVLLASSFAHLRVRDGGEHLEVRFGPLALFRRRIAYREMRAVEPARSSFIDGWGIHGLPGRGWIYNLWGKDCVRIELDGRSVRVGTDDVAGLVAFLRGRLAERGSSARRVG